VLFALRKFDPVKSEKVPITFMCHVSEVISTKFQKATTQYSGYFFLSMERNGNDIAKKYIYPFQPGWDDIGSVASNVRVYDDCGKKRR